MSSLFSFFKSKQNEKNRFSSNEINPVMIPLDCYLEERKIVANLDSINRHEFIYFLNICIFFLLLLKKIDYMQEKWLHSLLKR